MNQLRADEDLQPTVPVEGVPVEVQANSMRLLRRMRVAPEHPHELPDQLVAWANSNSLSRSDMAIATGFDLDQVSQIIHETAERDHNLKAHALKQQAARHLPT
jgi:hypothetical protein